MQKKLRKLLPVLLMLSKYAMLGFILQTLLLNLLMAKSGEAQSIYDVKIDLRVNDMPLKKVFSMIENETEFTFTYQSTRIGNYEVTLTGNEENLGEVLHEISRQTQLSFKQINYMISVRRAKNSSAAQTLGILTGKVVDAQTKEPLPGATVKLASSTTGTVTDINGEFILRLPGGEAEIQISYIGFKTYSETVTVNDGETREMTFALLSDVQQLEDVIITGVLQGQQKALNQQKAADNIKNIISADQIGRFPDPNVAEALQRVPAVNIERDQGEGRYVLVRGLAPQFTNININGEQIPSPEAGVRYVALDAVPADQLASIEVAKTLTPDMDGDAIGGSVNLITRTAQTERPSISASAVLGYNDIVQRSNFQGSLELGQRFFNNKLGIMLNTSYYETDRGSDNWERDGDDMELRDYDLIRTRFGLSSTIDYKFNDKNEIYFRSIYNRFTDREWRRRYVLVPNVDESPFEDNEIERLTKDRLEKQIVNSYNLGAKHTFNAFSLDYEVAYAEAFQDTPFDLEVASVGQVDQLSIDFDGNPDFPSFTVDDEPHTNPENIYLDNSIYEFDEVTMGNTYAKDINKTAKINISFPYLAGVNQGLIKFGGKVRLKEKSYDITENVFSWTGGDVTFPGFPAGDYTLEKFSGGPVDNNFLEGRYTLAANADVDKVINHFNNNQAGYELDVESKLATEAVEAYEATEDVYAAYLMTRYQTAKMTMILGVRYEKTSVNYSSQNVINESEIIPQEGGTDYDFFLPQLNLKYQLDNLTNIRAAITRSYARPNFSDIIPAQEININEGEASIGNPELKPVSATNIDILGEHYFGTVGILSGGLFYKNLNDFIFARRFESDVYPGSEGVVLDVTQSQNGDAANLFGFELAYQQNLTFLPGFFQGLSVYANYTYTSSKAEIQSRTDDGEVEEIRLPGQAKSVGNFSLAYDFKRLNVRLSANFNGTYLSEIGDDADEDLYVKERLQLDATATYTIHPRLRFFAEFLNITNQPFEVYQGEESRYIQREFYSWWTRLGLKFDW